MAVGPPLSWTENGTYTYDENQQSGKGTYQLAFKASQTPAPPEPGCRASPERTPIPRAPRSASRRLTPASPEGQAQPPASARPSKDR
jgi:hypothetical protein